MSEYEGTPVDERLPEDPAPTSVFDACRAVKDDTWASKVWAEPYETAAFETDGDSPFAQERYIKATFLVYESDLPDTVHDIGSVLMVASHLERRTGTDAWNAIHYADDAEYEVSFLFGIPDGTEIVTKHAREEDGETHHIGDDEGPIDGADVDFGGDIGQMYSGDADALSTTVPGDVDLSTGRKTDIADVVDDLVRRRFNARRDIYGPPLPDGPVPIHQHSSTAFDVVTEDDDD